MGRFFLIFTIFSCYTLFKCFNSSWVSFNCLCLSRKFSILGYLIFWHQFLFLKDYSGCYIKNRLQQGKSRHEETCQVVIAMIIGTRTMEVWIERSRQIQDTFWRENQRVSWGWISCDNREKQEIEIMPILLSWATKCLSSLVKIERTWEIGLGWRIKGLLYPCEVWDAF